MTININDLSVEELFEVHNNLEELIPKKLEELLDSIDDKTLELINKDFHKHNYKARVEVNLVEFDYESVYRIGREGFYYNKKHDYMTHYYDLYSVEDYFEMIFIIKKSLENLNKDN